MFRHATLRRDTIHRPRAHTRCFSTDHVQPAVSMMSSKWTTVLAVSVSLIVVVAVAVSLGVALHSRRARNRVASVDSVSRSEWVKTTSSASSRVQEFPNTLTESECDELIALASHNQGLLSPSLVYQGTATSSKDTEHRVSDQMWIPNSAQHPVVKKLNDIVSQHSQSPVSHQESLQIVRYKAGGFFRPHYDPCYDTVEKCAYMRSRGGDRRLTYLFYLNDDYEGGNTVFVHQNKIVVPEKGKMVVFENMTPDGEIILDSYHAGLPVTRGTKWICNKWVHMSEITSSTDDES